MTATGCGAIVREYGHHLRHDPGYAAKARRISEMTKDLSEILAAESAALERLAPQGRLPKIAFHPPCSMQHWQSLGGVAESAARAARLPAHAGARRAPLLRLGGHLFAHPAGALGAAQAEQARCTAVGPAGAHPHRERRVPDPPRDRREPSRSGTGSSTSTSASRARRKETCTPSRNRRGPRLRVRRIAPRLAASRTPPELPMPPRLILAAVVAVAAAPAFGQAGPQIRPGLWEMTLTGMPQKQTVCFTPEMVKDMKSLSQQKTPDSDCKSSGEAVSGNTRTFNVSCTKPNKYDAKISVTVNGPDNFTMTAELHDGPRRQGPERHDDDRLPAARRVREVARRARFDAPRRVIYDRPVRITRRVCHEVRFAEAP